MSHFNFYVQPISLCVYIFSCTHVMLQWHTCTYIQTCGYLYDYMIRVHVQLQIFSLYIVNRVMLTCMCTAYLPRFCTSHIIISVTSFKHSYCYFDINVNFCYSTTYLGHNAPYYTHCLLFEEVHLTCVGVTPSMKLAYVHVLVQK